MQDADQIGEVRRTGPGRGYLLRTAMGGTPRYPAAALATVAPADAPIQSSRYRPIVEDGPGVW